MDDVIDDPIFGNAFIDESQYVIFFVLLRIELYTFVTNWICVTYCWRLNKMNILQFVKNMSDTRNENSTSNSNSIKNCAYQTYILQFVKYISQSCECWIWSPFYSGKKPLASSVHLKLYAHADQPKFARLLVNRPQHQLIFPGCIPATGTALDRGLNRLSQNF